MYDYIGREMIFTDYDEITKDNVLDVINKAFVIYMRNELLKELQGDLEVELSDEIIDDSDKASLPSKKRETYRTVKRNRNYQKHHTQEFIDTDMYDVIKNLALYDWGHIGGEGEVLHSENRTSRTWEPRNNIIAEVIPFANVL